jgi:hypothetical protein
MAGMLERVVAEVVDDLNKLSANLKAAEAFHAAIDAPDFASPASATQLEAVPFSALDDVMKLAEDLGDQLAIVRAEVQESDVTLAELQSRMLKSELAWLVKFHCADTPSFQRT